MKKMTEKMTQALSTTKKGALDDLARRESPALSGLTPGVKASKGAFTLIELLVVIAIIAILAAMLLPVLNRAKAAGLKAQCISNFKQLQLCYRMYVDDNNDNLPLNNLGSGSTVTSWIAYITVGASAQNDYNTVNIRNASIYPYNQNVKIYVCPANNYFVTAGPGAKDDFNHNIPLFTKVPETRTVSVEYSMGSGGGNIPAWTDSGGSYTWNTYGKFTSIEKTRVSEKTVFCDEASGTVDDGAWAMWPMNTESAEPYWWNLPGSRHLNGGVFSFADGHAEYHKWIGTAVPSSSWQTEGAGNGGQPTGLTSTTIKAVTSADLADLAWAEAGGPQYP
jgi:prepilin-type N-terminal cleavage/methylation domain-containing protein/prepilin-type processing-associated H-X9-DG protein